MQLSDGLWITEGKTFILTGQLFGELIEIFQISFDFNLSVEKYRNNGLSGTSIVYNLSGKE